MTANSSRRRVLGALAEYARSDGPGCAVPERARIVRAILAEVRGGRGVELSPEAWRSWAIGLCEDATRRGASAGRARDLVREFLGRMDRRFGAFETALWRWAYDARLYGPSVCMGAAPWIDLEDTALALWRLTPGGSLECHDVEERLALAEEGRRNA